MVSLSKNRLATWFAVVVAFAFACSTVGSEFASAASNGGNHNSQTGGSGGKNKGKPKNSAKGKNKGKPKNSDKGKNKGKSKGKSKKS